MGGPEFKEMLAEMMGCVDTVVESDLLIAADISMAAAEVANHVCAKTKLCETEMEIHSLS
jgi:hypothetical protein